MVFDRILVLRSVFHSSSRASEWFYVSLKANYSVTSSVVIKISFKHQF